MMTEWLAIIWMTLDASWNGH